MAPPQAKDYSSRRLYSVLGPTESNKSGAGQHRVGYVNGGETF